MGLLRRRHRHGDRPAHLSVRAAHSAARTASRDCRAKTEEKKPLTGARLEGGHRAHPALHSRPRFFWATYEQQGNTINLWAEQFTNRHLIPGIIDWEIPVTWFQAFNPFMIFAFTPLVVMFWGRQAKRGKEPSTVTKMALGDFLLALSYLIMAAAAYITGPRARRAGCGCSPSLP